MNKLWLNQQWFGKYTNRVSIGSMFGIMFVYGTLLLMIGYTNVALTQITGLKGKEAVLLAIPQSIGLIVGTLSFRYLLSRFNIRWILSGGYLLALVCLILISQLDKITGATGVNIAQSNKNGALAAFTVLSFFMGLGISGSSPISSIYLSSIFKDKQRSIALSISNGVYGAGAGIIPLAAAAAIYNIQNESGAPFNHIRFFYYIAIGMAAIGLIISLMSYYKYEAMSLSTKNMDEELDKKLESKEAVKKNLSTKKIFTRALIIVIAIYVFYMITETISNYGLTNLIIGQGGGSSDKATNITATQCFGLFLLTQGLWRCVSGFTVTKWFRYRSFLTYSIALVITAFIIVLSGALKSNINIGFLVAVILGFGLGNIWPIIFAYAANINHEKSAVMGLGINITSMMMIPVTQAISGTLLGQDPISISVLIIVSGVLALSLIWILSFYLIKAGQPNSDDVRKHSFPLFKNKLKK